MEKGWGKEEEWQAGRRMGGRADRISKYTYIFNVYSLDSQSVPKNPELHLQVYLLTPSVQVPPFLHGLVEQSSGST